MSSAVRWSTPAQSTPSPISANQIWSVGHTLYRVGSHTLDKVSRSQLDIVSSSHTRHGLQVTHQTKPIGIHWKGSIGQTLDSVSISLDSVSRSHIRQDQQVTHQTVSFSHALDRVSSHTLDSSVGHTLDSVNRTHTRQNQQSYTILCQQVTHQTVLVIHTLIHLPWCSSM